MFARLASWMAPDFREGPPAKMEPARYLCPEGLKLEDVVFSHGVYGGEATSDAIDELYEHVNGCGKCHAKT